MKKMWVATEEDDSFLFVADTRAAARQMMLSLGWHQDARFEYTRWVQKMDGGYTAHVTLQEVIVVTNGQEAEAEPSGTTPSVPGSWRSTQPNDYPEWD